MTQYRLPELLRTQWRIITFRARWDELLGVNHANLAWGLFTTLLVGAGRWWDDPRAILAQRLGLGSFAYVWVLSAALWFFIRPLGATQWKYLRVVTLVSQTSLPALVYAIPVEKFLDMHAAIVANGWFLAIVAAWRVALLLWLVRKVGHLDWVATIAGSLLPVALIVVMLVALGVHHIVFDLMGGFRDEPPNQYEGEYVGLLFVIVGSLYAAPVLAVAWIVSAVMGASRPPTGG